MFACTHFYPAEGKLYSIVWMLLGVQCMCRQKIKSALTFGNFPPSFFFAGRGGGGSIFCTKYMICSYSHGSEKSQNDTFNYYNDKWLFWGFAFGEEHVCGVLLIPLYA